MDSIVNLEEQHVSRLNERRQLMLARIRTAQVTWLNVKLTLDLINTSRNLIEDDLISAMLVAGVLSANVDTAHQHPREIGRASEPGGLPDDLRRPVNAMSVALSLGIPRETARIKLASLLDRGILQKRDKGVILANDVLLSQPFIAAMTAFVRAISDFVGGLAALEACGVLEGDRLATPPFAVGGVASRVVTTHVLRGIDYARELSPSMNLTTQYILLSLSHLTGAALRVLPEMPEDGGRLAFCKPAFGPVRVAEVARFTRLPHETVRRQINRLQTLRVAVRRRGGWEIDFSDPAIVDRWLSFQDRTTVGTRQVIWKLYYSGVIIRGPAHGLTLGVLHRQSSS